MTTATPPAEAETEPSGGSVLRAILPTSFVLLTIFGSMSVVGPALATIQDDLGLSIFVTSAVASIFALGRLATGFPAGVWAERVGEGKLMSLGALGFLLGSALCAWSPGAEVLLGGRLVQGIGSAVVAAAALAYILRVVPPNRGGQAMSYYNGSIQLGLAFGPAVGGTLAISFGWRAIFVFSALAAGAAMAIAVVVLSRRRLPAGHQATAKAGAGGAPRLPVLLILLGVVPNVVCFFNRGGINLFGLPLLLPRGLDLDPTGTAYVLTFIVLCGLVLIGPAGRIVDRVGPRTALFASAPVVALGLCLFAAMSSVAWAYVAGALFSAGMAFYGPAAGAYLFALPGIPRNRAVGIYRLSTDVTQVVSPTVMAALVDTAGLGNSFLVAAAINVVLLTPMLLVRRPSPDA